MSTQVRGRPVRAMRPRAIAAVLSLLVAVPAVRSAAAPRSPVDVLEAQRQHAMVTADTTALDTLMADGMTYTHSTGLVQDKRAFLGMLASGSVRYLSFDPGASTVHDFGRTVVVTGTQTLHLDVKGKPLTSVSRYTVVWVRMDGRWRCVAYQSTALPEETGR